MYDELLELNVQEGVPMTNRQSGRTVGRPAGPTAKGAGTRAHIVDSAATVFADLGYDNARMSVLVDATGLTKGAVYFHFDSKESLALAVLEDKNREWVSKVRSALSSVPAGRRLEALLPTMLTIHRDDPTVWAVSKLTRNLTDLGQDSPVRRRVAEVNQEWVDLVGAVVGEAQERGEVRADLDSVSVAIALIGAFDGLKALHDTLTEDGTEPFASGAQALGAMVVAGLAPTGGA